MEENSNKKVSKSLVKAVTEENYVSIYSVFFTIIHEDPNFSTGKFDEVLEYIKANKLDGLFKAFDGKIFKSKENWNEAYWAEVVSDLVDNFSKERINHLKEIGITLYPKKPKIDEMDQNSVEPSKIEVEKKKFNVMNPLLVLLLLIIIIVIIVFIEKNI